MARYKDVDGGMKLLAVDLSRQLLPGTFEHALAHLIDRELDLSHFDAHYHNDERGSAAYPPSTLLKFVLFAYSQGIVSSRAIERACRDHVTFMALSGDSAPHFTTIAAFVSGREKNIAQVFAAVLSICLSQGLIGREMFAIDGVKLPSSERTSPGNLRTVEREPPPGRKRQLRGVLDYGVWLCSGERSGLVANSAFHRRGVSSSTRLAG